MKLRREIALSRKRLDVAEKLAFTDELTGFGNRRQGERELAARIESKAPFCVILIDVNRPSWVNNRYGRHCGDQVIKLFGQRLAVQFRDPDIVCRWGGDEFLVLVEGPLGDAMKRVYHIGPRLRGHYPVTAPQGEISIPVSASLGVAEYVTGESAEHLLARTGATLNRQRNIEVGRQLQV